MRSILVLSILLLGAFAFTGCTQTPEEKKQLRQGKDDYFLESLRYVKDPKTGLCFAYRVGRSGSGSALSIVPCREVEDYLASIPKGSIPERLNEFYDFYGPTMQAQLPAMEEKAVIGDGVEP